MSYAYEPDWEDSLQELTTSLDVYRHMIAHLSTLDDMEIIAYLASRDGIAWALEQLDGQVEQAVLDEIEELDRQLLAYAEYLVHDLDLYGDISRDEPRAFWWWYLDALIAEEPLVLHHWATRVVQHPEELVAVLADAVRIISLPQDDPDRFEANLQLAMETARNELADNEEWRPIMLVLE